MKRAYLLAFIALAPLARAQSNFLILIADDVGVDQLAAYGEGSDVPPTPNLDGLAASGVIFRNAWANPVCSPTRAAVLTGRHAFRTGVGHILDVGTVAPPYVSLPDEETTLPEMLDLGTGGLYTSAAFGKWHLYHGVGFEFAPNDAGFAHFAGTPSNLGPASDGYYNWLKLVDGVLSVSTVYATTDTVDEALAWLATAPEPWLCYVAFNAAHSPAHAPPEHLHTQDLSSAGPPDIDPRPYYKAMIEAMDTEIGRLFNALGPSFNRTTVVFLGDNGTPGAVTVPPFDPTQAKQSIHEGGINVPLIVSGPEVVFHGSETSALVSATDIFATVAEIAGIDLEAVLPEGWQHDSVSLLPLLQDPDSSLRRMSVFSQQFLPVGSGPHGELEEWTVRDERYKLIRAANPQSVHYPAKFYDLQLDPFESTDLLIAGLSPAELEAFRRLDREALGLLRSSRVAGPAGSESGVRFASNSPAGGGVSLSETFRVVSEVGQPAAAPIASSSSFRIKGGAAWTTGGVAARGPVIFGMQPGQGDKAGGEAAAVFGFQLSSLSGPLALGGQAVGSPVVASNTVMDLVTPSGAGPLANPSGASILALADATGLVMLGGAFTYLPALERLNEPSVGGVLRLGLSFPPDEAYGLMAGLGTEGVGLPIPPFQGSLELDLLALPILGTVGFSTSGQVTWSLPVPTDASLGGSTLQFQALAFDPLLPAGGCWSNRLDVLFQSSAR